MIDKARNQVREKHYNLLVIQALFPLGEINQTHVAGTQYDQFGISCLFSTVGSAFMTLDVFETVGVSFLQIQVLFVFKDDCRFFVLDFITYAFQGAFIIKKVVTDIFNMLPDVLKLSVFGKNRIPDW